MRVSEATGNRRERMSKPLKVVLGLAFIVWLFYAYAWVVS
jgi:hypothetical protein